jgi:hypothetical protein
MTCLADAAVSAQFFSRSKFILSKSGESFSGFSFTTGIREDLICSALQSSESRPSEICCSYTRGRGRRGNSSYGLGFSTIDCGRPSGLGFFPTARARSRLVCASRCISSVLLCVLGRQLMNLLCRLLKSLQWLRDGCTSFFLPLVHAPP